MSFNIFSTRSLRGQSAAAFAAGFFASSMLSSIAYAQTADVLPPINVTASRLDTSGVSGASTSTTDISGAPTPAIGIVGASTTVITAADIARSPAQTIQEIIGETPGVQITTLFGGINGAYQSVDVRGFGALAGPNTLILINGRRLNDLDLMSVDLSTIPRDSIERIEITRGNSGAVLYGDNAVGGVINVVTKTGSGPPIAMRAEGGVGSYNQRLGSASASVNQGPWSSSVYGNMIKADGYRANNALEQQNGIGDLRYTVPDFSAYLTLSGDNQRVGLPGGRNTHYTVDFIHYTDQLTTNPRGTSTPFDYGAKQGANATTGFTKTLWNGVDLIVDGGVRNKKQQSGFFGDPLDPFAAFGQSYSAAHLTTWSLTPRLSIKNVMFGLPSTILTGLDYYDAIYHVDQSELQGLSPIHIYNLSQQSLGAYWMHTIGVLPTTDVSYGARIQNTTVHARDILDMGAPGYFNIGNLQASPLDSNENNHALHIGIEHRFNEMFAVFGRAASAFRTPNVDERVNSGPWFDGFTPLPRAFAIKTQTSNDVEAGLRVKVGAFGLQSSVYNMNLTNELQFNPFGFYNYNLDPTHRYGSETSATLQASSTVLLRGSFTYARAVFREGQFTGNDIPLVSRATSSAGISWNALQRYLVVDATVRYWSGRRMDNDQANFQPLIPANATVDFKLSGEYERYFWSLSVNNVFNVMYYDYAIASPTAQGVFNAYPLPGRLYLAKAGATF